MPSGLSLDIEAIPFPVSVADRENRFVRVDRAFERVYGWRQPELVGRLPRLLTPQDVSETFLHRLDRATAAGGWRGRLSNRNRAGRRFEVFLVTHTLRSESAEGFLRLGLACRAGAEGALLAAVLQSLDGAYWGKTFRKSRDFTPSPTYTHTRLGRRR